MILHLTRGQRRLLARIHIDCEHCKLSSVAKHYAKNCFPFAVIFAVDYL